MRVIRPRRVPHGGTVGVLALSGPVDGESLCLGCEALRGMGLRVVLGENVGSRAGPLGLAGTDEEKVSSWRKLLRDPRVDAILLARGGYGITRLLPRLDPAEFRAFPKLHCGFSDGTALASFLLTRCGIPSLHGPMVAAELSGRLDETTALHFPAALFGEAPSRVEVPEADVLVSGTASGRLVGGCLSLLAALVGSPDEFVYDGRLLFLEEVGEEAYRVDRMLGTLAVAGRFGRLAGVLIGSMTRVTFGGREEPARLREALLERLAPLGVPVAAGLPFGHRLPNVVLPVGARASWDGNARALTIEEGILS